MLIEISEKELREIVLTLRMSDRFSGDRMPLAERLAEELANVPKCPYTHAHTRHWCGYEGCREN